MKPPLGRTTYSYRVDAAHSVIVPRFVRQLRELCSSCNSTIQKAIMSSPETSSRWAFRHSTRFMFAMMALSSFISLIASFVLSVDALHIAANPDISLSCDLNAVLSCGNVARSPQASLFGFPNAYLGMIAEAVVLTLAVAGLGGVKFPRWYMLTAQSIYTLGLVFAYWLFYQSYFNIGSLCPWCLVITVSTTLVFWYMTKINVVEGHLPPRGLRKRLRGFMDADADVFTLLAWFTLLTAMIFYKYGPVLLG